MTVRRCVREFAPPRQLNRSASSSISKRYAFRSTLLFFGAVQTSGHCTCRPAAAKEQTRWGNEHIVITGVIRVNTLRGTVLDPADSPMPQALVEVFTRGAKQRRIVACFTDSDGHFCLARLPAGRYELRCSFENFQAVSQTVHVVRSARVLHRVNVRLPVAT
jgi:hypothetical protein